MNDLEGRSRARPIKVLLSTAPGEDHLEVPSPSWDDVTGPRVRGSSTPLFPSNPSCLASSLTVEEKALVALARLLQHNSTWA